MKKYLIAIGILAGMTSGAYAQTATNNSREMTITATYVPGCTINFDNQGKYSLGTFSNLNQPIPSTSGVPGQFTYSCSDGQGATGISLSLKGTQSDTASTNPSIEQNGHRYLYSQTNDGTSSTAIPVNIYIGTDPSAGEIWGDGTAGTEIYKPQTNNPNGINYFTIRGEAMPDFKGGSTGIQYINSYVATINYAAAGGKSS